MIDKNQTNIHSIATIATEPVYDELVLLLRSIAVFHPNIPIFILTQSIVKKKLLQETNLPTNITLILELEKYGKSNWKAMNVLEAIEFLSQKSIVLEHALKHHANSLFMDADVTIASPLGLVDDSKDLGLSPRDSKNSAIYGKYNGGWVFVNNKKFPRWWRSQMAQGSSPLIEQFCLEDAHKHFSVFHFPLNYNLTLEKRMRSYGGKLRKTLHYLLRIDSDTNKGITYKDKPLISFHCRFERCINTPWYYFIMMHLYKGSPELYKLINSRTDDHLSDKFSANNENYVLAIQLSRIALTTILRKRNFRNLRSYQNKYHPSIMHKLSLTQKIIIIVLYPYQLINEGIYLYHATNRLTNREISWQRVIKIGGQAYCSFIKMGIQFLFYSYKKALLNT